MKLNNVLLASLFSLFSLFSLNAHAGDIKILSHIERHTAKPVQQDYSKVNLLSTCSSIVDVSYGDPDRGSLVNSHFNYTIQNTSIENQTYTVTQDTCIIGYGCDEVIDKVQVTAQRSGTYALNPQVMFYLPVGTYNDQATIQIKGENENCYHDSRNSVYVK